MDPTIVIVHLSDGSMVANDSLNWLELKKNLLDKQLNIEYIELRFRSNCVEPLPRNSDGYYFCKGMLAGPGRVIQTFVVGCLENGKLHKKTYAVPSLQIIKYDCLELGSSNEDCLIRRNSWIG